VLTCVCSIIFAIETLLPWPLMYYHDLPHACFSVSRHSIKAHIALTLSCYYFMSCHLWWVLISFGSFITWALFWCLKWLPYWWWRWHTNALNYCRGPCGSSIAMYEGPWCHLEGMNRWNLQVKTTSHAYLRGESEVRTLSRIGRSTKEFVSSPLALHAHVWLLYGLLPCL
jgi:hypothetical protein